MHYLDDFLIVAGSRRDCDEGLRTVRQVFDELKVPLAPHNVKGPATTLPFLGVEFDSVAAELRLPQAKLRELKVLVGSWLRKRFGKTALAIGASASCPYCIPYSPLSPLPYCRNGPPPPGPSIPGPSIPAPTRYMLPLLALIP